MSATTNAQKRSSILSSFVAHAKAHHESVNAAYNTYYNPGVSPSTSAKVSRNNSIAMSTPSEPGRRSSSDSSVKKAWKAVKKHNRDMNAAYSSYYSLGLPPNISDSRGSSVASTPRQSVEEVRHKVSGEKKSTWKSMKKAIVEHHRSLNAAYASTYGAGFKG